jgi:hypothetical protein
MLPQTLPEDRSPALFVLVTGLFGIGGGVVKGPLMLELGVPPDAAAATSATMIMFTAGSGTSRMMRPVPTPPTHHPSTRTDPGT